MVDTKNLVASVDKVSDKKDDYFKSLNKKGSQFVKSSLTKPRL